MNIVFWVIVPLLILGPILGVVVMHHHRQAKVRAAKLDWNLVILANILDAQAITGQAMPGSAELGDVKSFDGVHEFSFLDLNARESITVFLADSKPDMTMNEMMEAWNTYVKKVIAQQRGASDVNKWLDSKVPSVIGQKILKLRLGEMPAQRIQVPLLKGGMADGLEIRWSQRGKTYIAMAYGKPFSESAFIKFLDEWQNASPVSSQERSPERLSMVYTKRGERLEKVIIRRPEAMADFQKALQLDPNNSEAQSQLQSLENRLGMKT